MVQTLACLVLAATAAEPSAGSQAPFQERGYYITFMRMPTYDLAAWKRIVDGIHDDSGNLLLLWMGGAFRSQKFPITWKYNEEHQNVRHDFVRDLIDHAHTKGVRILLGFTPFGYDGVNHYPLEHPELRATGKDGKPVGKFGIGCWGYNLCPAKPDSQQFMLDYVREMFFDFYPNADGLMTPQRLGTVQLTFSRPIPNIRRIAIDFAWPVLSATPNSGSMAINFMYGNCLGSSSTFAQPMVRTIPQAQTSARPRTRGVGCF